MKKVQIQAEIEIHKLLAQLKTSQLEAILREVSAMINSRKAEDKKSLESKLLQKLNEEYILDESHWNRFNLLREKKESGIISNDELDELSKLILEEEQLRLKRIQLLGELASIKEISLSQLVAQLGIQAPKGV